MYTKTKYLFCLTNTIFLALFQMDMHTHCSFWAVVLTVLILTVVLESVVVWVGTDPEVLLLVSVRTELFKSTQKVWKFFTKVALQRQIILGSVTTVNSLAHKNVNVENLFWTHWNWMDLTVVDAPGFHVTWMLVFLEFDVCDTAEFFSYKQTHVFTVSMYTYK